jgi:hypothetical protein
VEALSSWLGRLARLYGLSVTDLLTHNLGLVDVTVPAELDYDPPAAMLAALAERTGVELVRLRAMTLAGQVPWLLDALHTRLGDAQEQFRHLRPRQLGAVGARRGRRPPGGPPEGEAMARRVAVRPAASPHLPGLRRRPKPGPSMGVAAAAGDRLWRARLPPGEHLGCRDVPRAGRAPRPAPVEEPVATLDRYTYQALTTGQVVLPGRTVHVAVWFRLLRSLLDEVSLALSTLNTHGRTTLERIWQATGRPNAGPGCLAALRAPGLGPAAGHAARRRHRAAPGRTLAAFEEQRAFLFGAGIPAAFLPSTRELGRADLA